MTRIDGRMTRAPLAILLATAFAQAFACAQPGTAPPATGGARLEPRLVVPAGLKVGYFATQLGNLRFMTLGPDGAVYASQPAQSRIVRVADVNGDGVADSITEVVTGLNRPQGLAFHKGWLYIANTDGVVRVRVGRTGRPEGAPEQVNRFSGGGGHWTRTVVFGPDSGMYVAIGSTCNLCVEQAPDRAAVMRFDEDGSNGKLFSSGLRNAVGMAVNPQTREIWVSQNERDNLPPDHEDLPPEEINILRAGGDFGWPYCYSMRGQAIPNPEYNDARRCASTIPAALEMQAHSAPLGMSFLSRATQLPAEYRSDLLVAFHGSWNRSTPTGAKVVRVLVRDGKPVGYEDFVTGWQLANGSRWGRPVDLLVYTDGSVLISDDASGAIYRVFR
ncbi:MAG: PQQ-dependent sugar dehydrogenase [Gemmatimonadaceae bacterium]